MLKLTDGKIAYDFDSCQQCGACRSVCPSSAISFTDTDNGLKNIVIDNVKCIRCQKCVKVCPANREFGCTDYIESLKDKQYFFAYNYDDEIRHASSSGGACKTLIIESLKRGAVDGVYSLRKLELYPSAIGEFYTRDNIPSYSDIPNSVYHSIMACTEIAKVKKVYRLMLVGTSCQLHALEKSLRGKYDELIKVCIFCKQQKTLDSTRFLAKAMGYKIPENQKFSTRYRGIGWPGIVRLGEAELPYSRAAQLPFGRRLWTVPGCNLCGDPFGMECGADISLMDPWIIRTANDLGETLVTVHTEQGLSLLESCKHLTLEKKTYEEVEPALGLGDIKRKRRLLPFFRHETSDTTILKAGKAEQWQRHFLQSLVTGLPRLPILLYRVICRLPDLRNIILK